MKMKGERERQGQKLLVFPIFISTPTPCAMQKVVGEGALHNFNVSNLPDLNDVDVREE